MRNARDMQVIKSVLAIYQEVARIGGIEPPRIEGLTWHWFKGMFWCDNGQRTTTGRPGWTLGDRTEDGRFRVVPPIRLQVRPALPDEVPDEDEVTAG